MQRHEAVRAELDGRVRGCERECSTSGRLGSIPQACARTRQQATREQVEGQGCRSKTGAVYRGCGQARRPCGWLRRHAGNAHRGAIRLKRVSSFASRSVLPAVLLQHMRVSRGGLAHEQEDLEVHGGVGLANQSGSIVSSHKSTTSSSSYSSSIARARPQHLEEAPEPPHRASSNPFAETSSPWQSQPPSPRVTVRNTPPAILHPLQSPASFFVTR
jgi:hypothetical protein